MQKFNRYFILVDDLWDERTCNIFSCAFPDDGNGSKVMVTTRLDDIALWACQNDHACIYKMKPLDEKDSKKLFYRRVYGSEVEHPSGLKKSGLNF